MGCNQPGVDEYPIPCRDAQRVALLTDFAAAMKAKLDLRDERYEGKTYTFDSLCEHLHRELVELFNAMQGESLSKAKANAIAEECIDVANMVFLLREKCFELTKEKE